MKIYINKQSGPHIEIATSTINARTKNDAVDMAEKIVGAIKTHGVNDASIKYSYNWPLDYY